MPFDPFGDFDQSGYLRNRAGERDVHIVRRLEAVSFGSSIVETLRYLRMRPTLAYRDLLKANEMMFGLVYPWAGTDRSTLAPTLEIHRAGFTDLFAHPYEIVRAAESAIATSEADLLNAPGAAFALLAYAHPFLDTNGRTILTFHTEMMQRVNRTIRWDRISKAAFLSSLTQELRGTRGALDTVIAEHVEVGTYRRKRMARMITEATSSADSNP